MVTYDSSRRLYHIGTIESDYLYQPDVVPPLENISRVTWDGEVRRDDLSVGTRNRLGSTLTLFRIPDPAAAELEIVLYGKGVDVPAGREDEEQQESEFDVLQRYKEEAEEFIKDRVSRLAPEEMEELVAGLLRAMGYRTRVSQIGPDRGVDIMASPDGFGFESPRIMVEVKHRPNTAMGSQQLRAFLGGRRAGLHYQGHGKGRGALHGKLNGGGLLLGLGFVFVHLVETEQGDGSAGQVAGAVGPDEPEVHSAEGLVEVFELVLVARHFGAEDFVVVDHHLPAVLGKRLRVGLGVQHPQGGRGRAH